MLNNLINISNLEIEDISTIMNKARKFQLSKTESSSKGKNVVLLFNENSTRTRFSFEMACHNLGLRIFHFDIENTSLSKDESIYDTVSNLYAIGIDCIIVRHSEENFFNKILLASDQRVSVINAGVGCIAHPTQALLDYYTLKRHFGSINGKKIVIVGDILHSRVAHSNIELLKKFDVNICLCAPEYFYDQQLSEMEWESNLNKALENADVVMALRVQKERLENEFPILDYMKKYRLDVNNFPQNAILLHPGPVNRDIEVSSKLLSTEKGRTILEQAKNGVYVRMAILDLILGTR